MDKARKLAAGRELSVSTVADAHHFSFFRTRLHMDMADAINVLMHANPQADGSPGCARWDIFRAEDADLIRNFLAEKHKKRGGFADPIHAQIFFLDSEARQELFEQTGVYSYRIYQYPVSLSWYDVF